MANDIDMWNDLEDYANEELADEDMIQDLLECYTERYVEGNIDQAEIFKTMFFNRWKFWGNWY